MTGRDVATVVSPDELTRVPGGKGDTRSGAEVHGVVLAAGTSSRFGDANKLLATVESEPIVRHATEPLLAADLAGVTVVVGYESDRVREVLADLAVEIRVNDAYAQGMSTSVAVGVAAAREKGADAVLIALGDMPHVDPETVSSLLDAYRRGAGAALAAAVDGRRGNPVLFDERYFDELGDVHGDVGGREILLTSDDAALVETGDPGVLADVDRPGDE